MIIINLKRPLMLGLPFVHATEDDARFVRRFKLLYEFVRRNFALSDPFESVLDLKRTQNDQISVKFVVSLKRSFLFTCSQLMSKFSKYRFSVHICLVFNSESEMSFQLWCLELQKALLWAPYRAWPFSWPVWSFFSLSSKTLAEPGLGPLRTELWRSPFCLLPLDPTRNSLQNAWRSLRRTAALKIFDEKERRITDM